MYVEAFVPDKGESIATVLDPQKYPGSLLGPDTTVARPVPNPSAPGGQDADISIKPQGFREVFAVDVSASEASVMPSTQRPLSYTAGTEPSGDPAWKTIPSWDLVTLNDKAIPPAGQRYMGQRARRRGDGDFRPPPARGTAGAEPSPPPVCVRAERFVRGAVARRTW
ncbi:hypothetical protein [Streptomyces monashensis]|uniref:Uncharacterized protein n=1 Tax=Streptomyces monashensis TaxID=1678012 RepID=A0A1S2QQA8_9ACTN|nr:hypothetical protein [Streptomyces monashensis]OIK07807.1 hypothetical protein BIV23_02215 [Streptomyces monashensis]